jgi:hypothetical protein
MSCHNVVGNDFPIFHTKITWLSKILQTDTILFLHPFNSSEFETAQTIVEAIRSDWRPSQPSRILATEQAGVFTLRALFAFK